MRNAALSLFTLLVCSSIVAAGHDLTAPTYAPSSLATTRPIVAASADRFLTVWTAGNHVYESLADGAGHVLTPVARPVLENITAAPAVAPLGNGFVLLTSVDRQPALFRLSDDGTVVQRLADPPFATTIIASNGDEILIANQTTAALLRTDGTLVGQVVLGQTSWAVAVAATSTEWLVASSQPSGIFVHRIGRDGVLRGIAAIDQHPLLLHPGSIAIASDGTAAVVLFPEGMGNGVKLWSAVVAEPFAEPAEVMVPQSGAASVLMRWTGANYLAIANGDKSASAFHFDRNGQPIDTPAAVGDAINAFDLIGDVAFAASTPTPALAFIWAIAGRGFAADAPSQTASTNLWIGLHQQVTPAVTSDGVNFFAAWLDETNAGYAVRAARMARDGTSLGPQGIDVFTTDKFVDTLPAVAYGSSTYIVVWSDNRGTLFIRRFRTDGSAIDAAPVTLPDFAPYPAAAVAWNGSAFLIIATRFFTASSGTVALTIGVDGPPSAPTPVTTYRMYGPHLAWNGEEFLLVGGLGNNCFAPVGICDPGPPLHGPTLAMRISPSGAPIDATPIVLDAPNLTTPVTTTASTVASNGRDFLVSLDGWPNVTVVPVTAHPNLIAGQRKSVFNWFGGTRSDIAFDGSHYVLTWSYRGATPQQAWLASARLTDDGDPVVMSGTSIERSPSGPAIALNDAGDVITAIDRVDSASGSVRSRAYFDWELDVLPSRPGPPRGVRAIGNSRFVLVQWDGVSADSAGVIVQIPTAAIATTVDQHSVLFQFTSSPNAVVRSFNGGGLSDPVTVQVEPPPRRRATR